jgi:hypothetical protein
MTALLALVLTTCSTPHVSEAAPASTFDHTHALWTEVLKAHVRGEEVRYKQLKADPAPLQHYLATLELVQPEEFAAWTRAQRYAFWINAYNAYTVRRVIEAYPIESVMDLGKDGKIGFWELEYVPLGKLFPEAADRKLTLDEIENKILRPAFKDARVHAAINCAARSCPPLMAEAFVAERLEDQLDARVEKWLADPTRNRFEAEKNRLHLSRLFEWYRDDFVRDAGSIQAWVGSRAPAASREWITSTPDATIAYLDYSWKLNDAK